MQDTKKKSGHFPTTFLLTEFFLLVLLYRRNVSAYFGQFQGQFAVFFQAKNGDGRNYPTLKFHPPKNKLSKENPSTPHFIFF